MQPESQQARAETGGAARKRPQLASPGKRVAGEQPGQKARQGEAVGKRGGGHEAPVRQFHLHPVAHGAIRLERNGAGVALRAARAAFGAGVGTDVSDGGLAGFGVISLNLTKFYHGNWRSLPQKSEEMEMNFAHVY